MAQLAAGCGCAGWRLRLHGSLPGVMSAVRLPGDADKMDKMAPLAAGCSCAGRRLQLRGALPGVM